MNPMAIEIRFEEVSFSYRQTSVLRHVTVALHPAQTVTVVGKSGCGKSTFLKLINGLLAPQEGSILLDQAPIDYAQVCSLRRKMGYVMQEAALFPHLTVKENLVLRMFSEVFHVTFDLPFNWGVFYFAAVCFSIGGIIYSLRCPEIVKRYSAFPGFVAEGRGVRYLRSVATTYRLGSGDSAAVKALLDEYEFVPGAVVGTKKVRNPEDRDPEKLADAFWIVHRAANHMDRTSLEALTD